MSGPLEIWIIIIGLGLGSWLIRFSFLGLIGDREMPLWFMRSLRYVGVGIMPAIVAPLVMFPEATGGQTDPVRLIAALVTFAVTLWQKNVLYGILAGMAALFGLPLILV